MIERNYRLTQGAEYSMEVMQKKIRSIGNPTNK